MFSPEEICFEIIKRQLCNQWTRVIYISNLYKLMKFYVALLKALKPNTMLSEKRRYKRLQLNALYIETVKLNFESFVVEK